MSGVAVEAAALLGRDRELGWLDQLVREGASGRSAVVVVTGVAGVGKTALLRAVSERAEVPVLSVAGIEQGSAPAYAGLAELCAPVRSHLRDLPPSHAGLLATAFGWAPASDEPAGPFGVGAALLGLLGGAAVGRGGPAGVRGLLVVVDDVDFLDPASREALLFAARRLSGEGIAVLLGARPDGPAGSQMADLEEMRLRGLDHAAGRALLASHASGPVHDAVAARLVDAAGGNPLALCEMAQNLSADQLSGSEPLPRVLPVGPRLREYFTARALALPDESRRALVVAAASFGNLAVVTDALGRLGLSPADLETIEDSGLVSASGAELTFRHPLTRCAVYHSASAEELRGVHLALAQANAAVSQLERQAWHLAQALAEPDEEAARVLEAAATSIRRRGAPAEAAAAFERSARLSVDQDTRAARLVSAAELWFLAGRTVIARVMAEEVLDSDPGPDLRGRAALVRGRALMVGSSEEEARRYMMEQSRSVAPANPAVAVALAATVSGSALRSGAVAEAAQAADLAEEFARHADPDARLLAHLAVMSVRVATGDSGLRARLVSTVEAELASSSVAVAGNPIVLLSAALALVWAEDYDNAARVLDQMETAARVAQLPVVLPAVLSTRAVLEHRVCRWTTAEAIATEALDLARQTGQLALAPYAATVLATADAVLGNAERCREQCLLLLDTNAARIPAVRNGVLAALGLLELGEGRPEEAVRWYEILSGAAGSPARAHPGIVMWGADLAEAYIDAGHADKAAVVADQLQEQATLTRSARVAAAAKRVAALTCPQDEEAERLFADALRHYGGPNWRFARARIGFARGRRLLRTGRRDEAETRLRQSLDLFEELGARGWAARVTAELDRLGVAAGGSTNPVADLSPLERQVALAAAMGGDPGAIAAGLFLGEATVAAALQSAAAKLGLAGPDGFAGLLADLARGGWAAPADGSPPRPSAPGKTPAADRAAGVLFVRLLGRCDISVGDTTIDCPQGPAGHLLKRVALAGRLPLEEVVEELWPEAAPGAGRSRLRTVLSRLRQAVGHVVVRDGGWIALAADVQVDVRQFEEAADAAQAAASAGDPRAAQLAHRALDLYSGPLLPVDRHVGFTAGPRERLRRRQLAMVRLAVEHTGAHADVERLVTLLERAIADNPHEEGLYLRAASLLADAGQTGAAAAMVRRARAALAELGIPLSSRGLALESDLGGR